MSHGLKQEVTIIEFVIEDALNSRTNLIQKKLSYILCLDFLEVGFRLNVFQTLAKAYRLCLIKFE